MGNYTSAAVVLLTIGNVSLSSGRSSVFDARPLALALFPILVLFFWVSCQSAKSTAGRCAARLRVLIPVLVAGLSALAVLNQWLFWQPLRDQMLDDPAAKEMLKVWASRFSAELAWHFTMIMVWSLAALRPPFRTQMQLCLLSCLAYTTGSALMFGEHEAVQDNVFRSLVLALFNFAACSTATKLFENADKQMFQDAVELASKLHFAQLAEHEKDGRVAAERRAVESERLLTAFLCHEIRNPLNGIAGSFDQIQIGITESSESEPHAELQQWCESGILSCKHLCAILDNVLDHSNLEEGQLTLEALPIDLHELCLAVKGMLM